ncbi:MAG: DUF4230 domain-containing protein [Actinomycetota bacterium]
MPTLSPEKEILPPGGAPEILSDVPPSRPRRLSGRRAVIAATGFALVVGLLLVLAVGNLLDWLPEFRNPFVEQRVDRSQPALLKTLEDLSKYRAAAGHYQVIIDVEEKVAGIPSAIKGERVLFVAAGSVDAEVDFSAIGAQAVAVSGEAVTVALPRARLSNPRLDIERSYVFERDRGLVDRLGSVFGSEQSSDREVYLLAEKKITAAAEESLLVERAERNTRAMLSGLLGSLGFTDVSITFR